MVRFVVQYASRGTASCKYVKCKEKIEKGSLRIGKISPSPFAEGSEMTNWFHTNCLFEQMKNPRAVKLESSEDLEGFDEIQAEDKELIQKLIEKRGDEPDSPKPGSSQKKRKSKNEASDSSGESSSKKSKKSKKSSSKSGEKGKSSKVDKKEEEKKKKRKKKSEKESESEDE